jgi:ribosome biogenesis GTPase
MAEGRIIKSLSGFYYVKSENDIFQCRGRGNFRKKKVTPLVGDFVEFEAETLKEGYILKVKPRKNELVRPPLANLDQGVLVFSVSEPDFSPYLLDRFLVQLEVHDIEPVICITKLDLIDGQRLKEITQYADDYRSIGYEVVLTSSVLKTGVDTIRNLLADRVSVFAGQSGVGKSALVNAFIPGLELETAVISKHLGRGKHTTRHVELIPVDTGFVADTPGFSSLDFHGIESDRLSYCFPEMKERLSQCKFRGCTHISEPKCAVKAAVESGGICKFRYKHYKTFLEEIKAEKRRY